MVYIMFWKLFINKCLPVDYEKCNLKQLLKNGAREQNWEHWGLNPVGKNYKSGVWTIYRLGCWHATQYFSSAGYVIVYDAH